MAAAGMNLEAGHLPRLSHGGDARLGHLVDIAFAFEPARHACNARHARDDVGCLESGLDGRPFLEEDAETARDAVDGHDREGRQQCLKVFEQALLERLAVVPLEPDLMVMDKADALVVAHMR